MQIEKALTNFICYQKRLISAHIIKNSVQLEILEIIAKSLLVKGTL